MSRIAKRPEDFTKFYYTQVANAEGCGCAEKIIDVHEFNRLAGTARASAACGHKKAFGNVFCLKRVCFRANKCPIGALPQTPRFIWRDEGGLAD